jgi:1,4-dihydroxy-2-naphthoate octaprenyltransferase
VRTFRFEPATFSVVYRSSSERLSSAACHLRAFIGATDPVRTDVAARASPCDTSVMLRALVRAARPLAHANIAPPILFGQALAYATTGRFSFAAFLLAQLFGVADHLFIVLANDYADREADAKNRHPTLFSGGSRVIQEGQLSANAVKRLAIASGAAVLGIGLVGSAFSIALPFLAVAAIALMLAYSYRPIALSYRGGGEILQGLGVGVVLPMVGLAAQGALTSERCLFLVPTFVLGVAGNVLTSIPDERADRDASKRTLAVRFGGRPARALSIALHVFAIVLAWFALPIASFAVSAGVLALTLGLQLGSVLVTSPDRGTTLRFLLLGGATESIALLGWSVGLVLSAG